jgi:hypothetical protein
MLGIAVIGAGRIGKIHKKLVAIRAEDQRRALVLADAALEAVKSGRAVRV